MSFKIGYFVCFLSCFLLQIANVLATEECVSLNDCPPLNQLVQNYQTIGLTRSDVRQRILEKRCGNDMGVPRVFCETNEEEEENITVGDSDRFNTNGVLTNPSTGVPCNTILKLYHFKQENDGSYRYGTLKLRNNRYRQIRKLNGKTVYVGEVTGNCCWTVHDRPVFRGNQKTLTQTQVLSLQPKSAEIIACPAIS